MSSHVSIASRQDFAQETATAFNLAVPEMVGSNIGESAADTTAGPDRMAVSVGAITSKDSQSAENGTDKILSDGHNDPDACPKCGIVYHISDWPFCRGGHGRMRNFVVIADSIPGGMVIENLSPTPQTFYSKADFRLAMDAAGVEQKVQHVGEQGSDKSPHTVRWI